MMFCLWKEKDENDFLLANKKCMKCMKDERPVSFATQECQRIQKKDKDTINKFHF